MGFNYEFEYAFPGAMEGAAEGALVGAAGIATGILLIVYLLLLSLSVVSYVLGSVGMYRIAKRRGIHHAWLAWIPVGNTWLLGSISDHYQYVAKQNVTKRRRILLILEIIMYVLLLALVVFAVILAVLAEGGAGNAGLIGLIAVMVVSYLGVIGVSIAVTVFCYIAYYDLFQSCRPGYSVLFLVLGILFTVALPFFVFGCSSSDQGMPARRVPKSSLKTYNWPESAQEEIPVVETQIVEEEIPEVEAEAVEDYPVDPVEE